MTKRLREMRDIVRIDEDLCDGCGICVPGCAEGAIEIIDGKAKLVAEKYCDGLGACLGTCPKDAITVIKREADSFDEEAVEERLHELKAAEQAQADQKPKAAPTLGCGCPGSAMATFTPAKPAPSASSAASGPRSVEQSVSALTHWPIQIRLIPPHAPFLKGANLLVAADCAPASYPALHQELLPGKVIMLGCPKFDDAQSYVERFVDIFNQAGINSITVLSMEVPCCAGLAEIVRQALIVSGKRIPYQEIVITRQGQIASQGRAEFKGMQPL
jgi:NAD-dependent dihydropyrimidine dehydrogenase PreA subunit